jgi:alpha-amylase
MDTRNKEWICSTNVYEVNLRQYNEPGSFPEFASHLPRLKDMGVETLWFMPITPISFLNRKGSMGSYYACSDYTSVNPEFGTLEDFKALVKKAHDMGFRVIMDWVANHTGWDHIWTRNHPDWYKKDEMTGDFKRASGMDDIIELDYSNRDMRKAMIDAMTFWVNECDIDGFRCDLAFWVQLDFWVEAKTALDKIKPLLWLAESDPLDHPEYMQVFDAAYTWTWMHRTEEFYKRSFALFELLQVLDRYQQAPGINAWFTSNHDENTWNGTEYDKYGDAAKMLAVFSCTWQGIPLIYSGQELPNYKRLLFFEKDVIEWNENFALHSFYKALLHLQRFNPALRCDSKLSRVHSSGDEKVLSYLRIKDNQEVLVFLNFSPNQVRLELLDYRITGNFNELFTQQHVNFDKQRTIALPGWGYMVCVRTNE